MRSLKSLSVSLLCLASWLYLVAPSQAQFNNSDGANFQPNEYDTLTGPSGLNPMDFIHRANFGTMRDSQQFQNDTNQQINDAAADFKRQQQEQLQNQSPSPEDTSN